MLNRLFNILICLICFQGFAFSQNPLDSLFFKKTSSFEREMTRCEYDTTADAVILVDKMDIEVDPPNVMDWTRLVEYRHYRKIKILKKSGIKTWGTFNALLANLDDLAFEAIIFSPDGKFTILRAKDLFVERLNLFTRVAKISFPKIEVGSIIEIRTSVFNPNKFRLKTWYFQNEVPTIYSTVNLIIPSYYNYAVVSKGLDQNLITSERIKETNTFTYSASSVKAMLPESYTTTVNDFRVSVTFQLNEYKSNSGKSYQQLASWDEFSQQLWSENDFGNFFLAKNSKKTWSKVKDLISESATCEQRISTIYNWLNEQIIWDGQYDIMQRSGSVDDIFKKKSASSGELNAILLVLLKRAEIHAEPVFLSTRSNGYVIQNYPVIDQFNHFIIKANCAGKDIFLDGGNKYRPVNELPFEVLNEVGILVPKVGEPKWIKLPVQSGVTSFEIKGRFDENAVFVGHAKLALSGELGVNFRESVIAKSDTTRLETTLSRINPGLTITNKKFIGKETVNEPFVESFDFSVQQQVNGDLLYFNPVLDANFLENPFKSAQRLSPMDFGIQINESYRLEVELPKGYSIESAPTDLNANLFSDAIQFNYKTKLNGRQLKLEIDFQSFRAIYPQSEYIEVQRFFDLISQKYSEQFVLKKTP